MPATLESWQAYGRHFEAGKKWQALNQESRGRYLAVLFGGQERLTLKGPAGNDVVELPLATWATVERRVTH